MLVTRAIDGNSIGDPIPGLEWEEADKCHMLESVWDRGGMRNSAGT